jgi:hypothetical protein
VRVLPQSAGDAQAQVWAYADGSYLAGGVWSEKVPGSGQDAEPTIAHHRPSGRGIIGVYDGMGGAGTAQIGTRPDDGRVMKDAFAASRIAHLVVSAWYRESARAQLEGNDPPRTLKSWLDAELAEARPKDRKRGFTGTLAPKDLPTTLATIEYEPLSQTDRLLLRVRWAGDSRCLQWTPADGLQQLSADDVDHDDVLDVDQALTNYVNVSLPYDLRLRERTAALPVVLLCITDGFYAYKPTPAHLEFLLLETLQGSETMQEWMRAVATGNAAFTGDDASLACVAFGFADFAALRAAYAPRFERLNAWREIFRPTSGDNGGPPPWDGMWADYGPKYIATLGRSPDEAR